MLRYTPQLNNIQNPAAKKTLSQLKVSIQDYKNHVGITNKEAFSNIRKAVGDNPKLTRNALEFH